MNAKRVLRILVCLGSLFVLIGTAALPTPAAAQTRAIYADQLETGWEDWSWGISANYAASSPVHSGTHSLALTYTSGWAGLSLHKAVVNTAGTTFLHFFMHGGSAGGQKISLFLDLESNGSPSQGPPYTLPLPQANQWTEVKVPLSAINPNNYSVTRLTWQSGSGSGQSVLYLDDISWDYPSDPNGPSLASPSLFPRAVPTDGRTGVIARVAVGDPQGLGDIASVSLDGTAFGMGLLPLLDDGRSNDGAAGDGIYATVFTLAPSASPGEHFLVVTALDKAGHAQTIFLGALVGMTSPGGVIPSGLPQKIGWGTNAWDEAPGQDWQINTGLPWNYDYQYLTYDWYVNGWGGSFVTRFVSHAWTNHFIPVVTIYNMLGVPANAAICQPNQQPEGGLCYAAKLQEPAAVQYYLASIQEAARQASGSQPVIFALEPDFYGYMQQLSNDPALRPAGVQPDNPASYPVALNKSGYANNLAGFGTYLVDLIHSTAPNALVAPMASMWATSRDPFMGTGAEAVQLGQRTAAFIDAMGGTKSDALIVEWSDRDAGSQIRPWWDDSDQELPRPSRAVLWENALSHAAGKRLLLWQVPAGNMGLDNTCDHYQDNRAAYAFSHPRDLFDAGVFGVVFGGGATCMTQVTTDGGFIAAQAAIAYAPPAAPTSLSAGPLAGNLLPLRWNASTEPDHWKYAVYAQLQPAGQTLKFDPGRMNSIQILLPFAGTWKVWLTSLDAMGSESLPTSKVDSIVSGNARQVYLPLVSH